jgi:hypothetical protein
VPTDPEEEVEALQIPGLLDEAGPADEMIDADDVDEVEEDVEDEEPETDDNTEQ